MADIFIFTKIFLKIFEAFKCGFSNYNLISDKINTNVLTPYSYCTSCLKKKIDFTRSLRFLRAF